MNRIVVNRSGLGIVLNIYSCNNNNQIEKLDFAHHHHHHESLAQLDTKIICFICLRCISYHSTALSRPSQKLLMETMYYANFIYVHMFIEREILVIIIVGGFGK